jgi:hypothetical protein
MERRRGRDEGMEVGGVREGSRLGEKERRREGEREREREREGERGETNLRLTEDCGLGVGIIAFIFCPYSR